MTQSIQFRALDAFGYHTSDQTPRRADGLIIDADTPLMHTIYKILAYIPLIGTFIGVCRMIGSWGDLQKKQTYVLHHKSFHQASMARGVVEALSLGILFLIPDIIVSIGRAISSCTSTRSAVTSTS